MKAESITQLCYWLDCTELDLFRAAWHWKYGEKTFSEDDLIQFAANDVQPLYFKQYMRRFISKLVIRGGRYDKKEILLLHPPL